MRRRYENVGTAQVVSAPMDLAYHIQIFLNDLSRRVTNDVEITLIAFVACAVLLYVVFGKSRRAIR